MDYFSSWVDTSLDLYTNPHRVRDDSERLGMAKEVQGKFKELGRKHSEKEQFGALEEELNRVSEENKKLREVISAMCGSYNALRGQMIEYMSKASKEKEISGGQSKKRKSESGNNNNDINYIGAHENSESSSADEESNSSKKPKEEVIKSKISRVCVKTEASNTSQVVKDGYQWRKYGQKVTRDNPSPRAYFKCSFAPSCPVKKKVQRSVEDQSVLVATYEGEHNHPYPTQMEATSAGSSRSLTFGSVPCSASLGSSGPTITLDLAKSNKPSNLIEAKISKPATDALEVRQFFVEQMASSLTKDPNFTGALVAAISGRMFQQNLSEKW